MRCEGNHDYHLVVVIEWRDHDAQAAWENAPGVVEYYPENMAQPIPAEHAKALAPHGVRPGMTQREMFQAVGAAGRSLPAWRP